MTETTKEALLNLRYAVGIAAEVYFALWLLAGGNATGPRAWLGYLLLATSAAMTIYGVIWYGRWFTALGLRNWYIAMLMFALGCVIVWLTLPPPQPFSYERAPPNSEHETIEKIQLLGGILVQVLPAYCLWRSARWITIKAFKVLLIAISQIGSAWRGELS
jgi:hypothetical protein